MPHSEGTFPGINGIDLYYQTWHPTEAPKATLGIVHGLGSHSGWFQTLAEALATRGYATYSLDLRGHGRSPGQRAYINQWSEFRGDIKHFHQLIKTQHPHIPCFVLGHSLGAIILLDAALRDRHTLSGLILMAPSLNPSGVPTWRLVAGQILSWVYPRFSLDTGIPQTAGSRNPDVITAYTNDPLRHRRGTARLVSEFLKTIRWIDANLNQLNVPVLVLHGGNDIVTPPTNSRELFEKLAIADKEYCEYPDAYHDLHNDLDMSKVVADIANWLDCHLEGELNIYELSDRRIHVS